MVSMRYFANNKLLSIVGFAFLATLLLMPTSSFAQDAADVAIDMAEEFQDIPVASTVRLLVILTSLTFIPAMLLAMTPFTRFIIVFSMIRQAIGLQQSPPNQVLIGLAMFLSIMIMQPTFTEVYETSINPFLNGELAVMDAFELFMKPMRRFMLANTRKEDLTIILNVSRQAPPESLSEIPHASVVSAFLLSELKTAFIIGVKIYLPFLVIDIIVANILLGMGMMVLPPVVLSLPLKILLFVLMDGWSLLIRMMVTGFHGI